jgi:anti-sigma factor RsiW
MNCSQHDLKGYILGELPAEECGPLETHLKGCLDCREEVERLRLTRTALDSLPEEEIPRRIAFVSDKVFEPRGWAWLWNSAPRLVFASATLLALAIVVHAFVRPAPVAIPMAANSAAMEARVEGEVAKRLQPILEKAAAESEARQARQVAELVAAAERRVNQQRQADLVSMEETLNVLQKRWSVYQRASYDAGGGR